MCTGRRGGQRGDLHGGDLAWCGEGGRSVHRNMAKPRLHPGYKKRLDLHFANVEMCNVLCVMWPLSDGKRH